MKFRFNRFLDLLKISALGLLSFFSCAKEITIDLPDEPTKVVVISHFTPGEPFRVKLELSRQAFEATDPKIPETNMTEVILSSGGQFLDRLKREGVGKRAYWVTNNDSAMVGQNYTLYVKVAGYPPVEASSKAPQMQPINPVAVNFGEVRSQSIEGGKKQLKIPLAISLQNLPSANRYFAFNIRHDTEVLRTENGETWVEETFEGLQTNYTADGRTLALLHNISEPVVLINEKFWNEDSQTLFLNAVITYNALNNEKPRRLYIEWRTLSEEYYKYHLSIDRQGNNLPLSEPDAIFNNVLGGYGTFSGYTMMMDTIVLPD